MIKINNKVWTLTFLITLLLIAIPNVISECQSCDDLSKEYSSEMVGMKNPAAVYCTELGYEYKIIKTPEGERGMCAIPDTGEEFDAWGFLEGEVGQEHSYCATIGCDTITATDGKNSFSSDYAVCVPKQQSVSEHFVTSSSESMSVTDLMNLDEKVYPKLSKSFRVESVHTLDNDIVASTAQVTSSEVPLSFDWRDVDGKNWVTTVKNQGKCGSCWAFAAVAAVEAKMNIVMNNSDFDIDLSEQYLVSDCCYYCGSCFGGSSGQALNYIKNYGITDEECFPYDAYDISFPYTGYESLCSDKCSLWDKRLYTIDDFGWNTQGTAYTKDTLKDYGPLAIYIAMNGSFDQNGIYRNATGGINHVVLLVGYNDSGEYWIAKNSWGTGWQGSDAGYFKIGYGECYVNYYPDTQLAVVVSEDTYYNYPLPLPTPRPISVPLPLPPETPKPVPLPIPLSFFMPIPLPFSLP